MSSVILGLAALTAGCPLEAQARSAAEMAPKHPDASTLLSALAHYRAVRWASASPVIQCVPAPLTERPQAESELARPRVVPLEEAFADAESVKRAIAYRMRAIAVERR